MNTVTRRSLILSGAGLATAAFVVPAEAATGSVSLHIASAGFIFGVTGGSGTLTFRGQQFPLRVGGISAGALIGVSATDLVGTASNLHSPGDIAGIYSAHRRRHVDCGRQKHRAALQRQRREAAPSWASGRLQLLDRPQRNEHLARLSPEFSARDGTAPARIYGAYARRGGCAQPRRAGER